MKTKHFSELIISLFILFLLFSNFSYSQVVTIKKLNGKEIHGILLAITIEQVSIDPDGPLTYLSLSTKDLKSITFSDGTILEFPLTQEMIPEKYKKTNEDSIKHHVPHHHITSYGELYLFGGISSKATIGQIEIDYNNGTSEIFDLIYKNGGFGGLGFSFMEISKNRRPDIMIDFEMALYIAKMDAKSQNQELELLTGTVLSFDIHFSLFPIKARNKYPSPFAFAGIGTRLIEMGSKDDNASSAKEFHGEFPFGLGVRQKISRGVAFQIKERFVYSKLKGVSGFILPETRLELYITIGKS